MGFLDGLFGSKKDERHFKGPRQMSDRSINNNRDKSQVREIEAPSKPESWNVLYEFNKQAESLKGVPPGQTPKSFYKAYKKLLIKYTNNTEVNGIRDVVLDTVNYVPATPDTATQIYKGFEESSDDQDEEDLINLYLSVVEKGLKDDETKSLWQNDFKALKKAKNQINEILEYCPDDLDVKFEALEENMKSMQEPLRMTVAQFKSKSGLSGNNYN